MRKTGLQKKFSILALCFVTAACCKDGRFGQTPFCMVDKGNITVTHAYESDRGIIFFAANKNSVTSPSLEESQIFYQPKNDPAGYIYQISNDGAHQSTSARIYDPEFQVGEMVNFGVVPDAKTGTFAFSQTGGAIGANQGQPESLKVICDGDYKTAALWTRVADTGAIRRVLNEDASSIVPLRRDPSKPLAGAPATLTPCS